MLGLQNQISGVVRSFVLVSFAVLGLAGKYCGPRRAVRSV